MTSPAVPLLLDVDTGVDDCVALLLALASPGAELVAVTCVAGNVAEPQVEQNTRAVLELAGADGVEVAGGATAPLVAPLRTARSHGPQGLGHATLPPARTALSPRFGPDLIAEEARLRPGEVVLVATGPLTNVALAVRREPALPRLLRRLAVMGGAFDYSGNTSPAAEFNVAVDPEAAKAVFDAFGAAERPPLVCGLNVTERAELRPEHLERLAAEAGASNPIVRLLSDALRFSMEAHESYGHGYLTFMHDPLALAAVLDESLGERRAGTVDVELAGTLTRGMTVVDWRGVWGRPPNAELLVGVDGEAFVSRLVERLARLAADRG
jgi:purine nucleosidase